MYRYKIIKSDRISEVSVEATSMDVPRIYVNSFCQDTQNAMPYQSSSDDSYHVELSPKEATGLRFVANLFRTFNTSLDLYPNESDLSYCIEQFIRETASDLCYHGRIFWEIVTLTVSDGDSVSELLWLAPIPGRVYRKGQHYRQMVKSDQVSTVYFDMPLSKVWVIEIPRRFSGPRKHRELIQSLEELSEIMPDFVSNGIKQGSMRPGFDVNRYSHNRFARMAKLMRQWGWMSSQWQQEETTKYYWVYRQLSFYSSLAYLRQYILGQMNELLKRLETGYQISIEGLPTESDIAECIDKLQQGEISFKDALNLVYRID